MTRPRATSAFPVALLGPIAVSSVAAARVPGVALWALVVLGVGILVRVGRLLVRVEATRSRLAFALAVSAPSVATAWVAIQARLGAPAGPALLTVACALLGLALAGPPTAAALSAIAGLSLAQLAGADVLAPGATSSALTVAYVAVLVPVLVRLASPLAAPRREEATTQARRVMATVAGPRRSARPALGLLAGALPLGLWFHLVLPHQHPGGARGEGPAAARGGDDDAAEHAAAAAERHAAGSLSSFVSGGKTSMRLGFVAHVGRSQKPVLLVEVDDGARGPAEPLTLRGYAYDVYTGADWGRSESRLWASIAAPDRSGWARIGAGSDPSRRHRFRVVDVTGDPGKRLFVVPEPVRVRLDDRLADRRVGSAADGVLGAFVPLPPGAIVEQEAELPGPDRRAAAVGRRCDAGVAPSPRLVDAPPDVARFRAIAREIVGEETDPARRAERIEAHLRRRCVYATEMPEPDPKRPVLDFLERIRRGHCEYFASSMALLLRSLGHPARLAVGFRGGDWLETVKKWSFRGNHAHAWCEVWFEGLGWTAYDPTPGPDRTGDTVTRADGGPSETGGFLDRLVRFSPEDREGLLRALRGFLGGVGATLAGTGAGGLAAPIVLLALLAVVVVARAARRRTRSRALGATDRAGAALGPYGLALAELARAGMARRPPETSEEHARRVERARPAIAGPLATLAALHEGVRFGGRPAAATELACAEAALLGLRRGLI